jgi:hypothetical protein
MSTAATRPPLFSSLVLSISSIVSQPHRRGRRFRALNAVSHRRYRDALETVTVPVPAAVPTASLCVQRLIHRQVHIMKILRAAIACLMFLPAACMPAQTLRWSTPVTYDKGTQSAVAMNDLGMVVEVHKSQNKNTLYYHIGKVERNTGTVTWGKSQYVDTGRDTTFPTVAFARNTVIISYMADGLKLFYRTGTLDPTGSLDQAISWFVTDKQYDTGGYPSISMNTSGQVLEVHVNNLSDKKLFYRYGRIDPESRTPDITWITGANGIAYDYGVTPRASINDGGSFVEVHQEGYGSNLHYIRGYVLNNKVTFRATQFLPKTGTTPSVVFTRFHLAVSTLINSNSLFSTAGYDDSSDPPKIAFQSAQKIQDGVVFSGVATDGDWILATFNRGSYASDDLQYVICRTP